MTLALNQWYANYQEANPEKFNDEFIYMRKQDDLQRYMHNISKALEVIDGIEFLDCRIIEDESKFEHNRESSHLSIEETRMVQAIVRFRIAHKDQEEDIELKLFFPKLIDDFFFELNGSRYCAIYQLVDRGTYATAKTFSLKTLLMPIVFRTDTEVAYTDKDGVEHSSRLLLLDIFKQRRNLLYYFMAKLGVTKTLEFFDYSDQILIIDEREEDSSAYDDEGVLNFSVSKNITVIADPALVEDEASKVFLMSFLQLVEETKVTPDKQDDLDFWLKRLGKCYTKNTNAYTHKANRVLISLERILDETTKENLAHVADEDKKSIYGILRWMSREYETLSREDNMDVQNKRIRLYEYLIHPILMKFSRSTYRLLNSKSTTFNQIKSIFNSIGPTFAIKKLVTGKILRYNGCVNGMDLFASGLKWTQRGPQSMADSPATDVAVKYRGMHPSYVGRIELSAASASDPGMSGTFVPFCKTNGFFFELPKEDESK